MNDLFTPDDTRDALRKLGGILLGLAALMIAIRKGPFISLNPDQWAAFPMFLVLAIPAVYLYGAIFTIPRTGELRVWQVVHSTFRADLRPARPPSVHRHDRWHPGDRPHQPGRRLLERHRAGR